MTESTLRPISDVEQGWYYSSGGGGSGTLHLVVDSFDKTWREMDEYGNDPFLDTTSPNDKVDTSIDLEQDGWFTYQNSGKNEETITSVKLLITVKGDGDDAIRVYLHDGTSEHDLGTVTGDPDIWTDEEIDVSAILDTWAKIDAAKIRVRYEKLGKAAVMGVCYSELAVGWELARTDYTEVDEEIPDEDATLLSTGESGNNEDDLFGFEPFNLPEGESVNWVRVYGRAKAASGGKGGFGLLIKPTTTKYYNSGDWTQPDEYEDFYAEWAQNPDGGAWTEDAINSLSAGVRGKSQIQCILGCTIYFPYGVTCTQCYIIVNYSAEEQKPKRMLLKVGR